ncbi:hypothetical protein AHF37_05503 [Paragonimus kellicotti]|nr:hypothetical protein AHF37_05503 [Paragonimus kellicotti]
MKLVNRATGYPTCFQYVLIRSYISIQYRMNTNRLESEKRTTYQTTYLVDSDFTPNRNRLDVVLFCS